MLLICFCFI